MNSRRPLNGVLVLALLVSWGVLAVFLLENHRLIASCRELIEADRALKASDLKLKRADEILQEAATGVLSRRGCTDPRVIRWIEEAQTK